MATLFTALCRECLGETANRTVLRRHRARNTTQSVSNGWARARGYILLEIEHLFDSVDENAQLHGLAENSHATWVVVFVAPV